MSRIKDKSKRYWSLVKKLAVCEKELDEERRVRKQAEEDVEYLRRSSTRNVVRVHKRSTMWNVS